MEPSTGKVHRTYTYKEKACTRYELTSRRAQHLAGYTLIEKDLRSVLIWLREIDRLGEPERDLKGSARATDRARYDLVKGFFVAALTFYGKCFTGAEGRLISLDRKQIDERFRALHDECMGFRNNFAAHSGAKRIETVSIALAVPLKQGPVNVCNLYRELYQPDVFRTSSGETTMIELVEHVGDIANKKIDLLAQSIFTEEVVPKWGELRSR
jgi:hypothetical protein